MIKLFRHRRPTDASNVTFCDSCGQVCTAACRTDAHYERVRTLVLTAHVR